MFRFSEGTCVVIIVLGVTFLILSAAVAIVALILDHDKQSNTLEQVVTYSMIMVSVFVFIAGVSSIYHHVVFGRAESADDYIELGLVSDSCVNEVD